MLLVGSSSFFGFDFLEWRRRFIGVHEEGAVYDIVRDENLS